MTGYSVTHWGIPPVGFEGTFAVAGFAWIGTIACAAYCAWGAVVTLKTRAGVASRAALRCQPTSLCIW